MLSKVEPSWLELKLHLLLLVLTLILRLLQALLQFFPLHRFQLGQDAALETMLKKLLCQLHLNNHNSHARLLESAHYRIDPISCDCW